MLGAAGALLCMALGTALGAGLKERRCARLRLLENEMELLARMRLLILEERLGLPALLRVCASDGGEGVFPTDWKKRRKFWKSTRCSVCGTHTSRQPLPFRSPQRSLKKRLCWTVYSLNWAPAPPPCGNRRHPAPSAVCVLLQKKPGSRRKRAASCSCSWGFCSA